MTAAESDPLLEVITALVSRISENGWRVGYNVSFALRTKGGLRSLGRKPSRVEPRMASLQLKAVGRLFCDENKK